MKKAEKLEYPPEMIQTDYRTDPSIIPGKEDLSYGRAIRSAASKPSRLLPCADVYQARKNINNY